MNKTQDIDIGERNITVDGKQVILHAWTHDPREVRIDYSEHLKKISSAIASLEANGKPKLIGIKGPPGSGKSALARVLAENGNNTRLINVCDPLGKEYTVVDGCSASYISPLISDVKTTYIIDEAGLRDPNTLHTSIKRVTESGGIVVLLYQDNRDLPLSISGKLSEFILSRTGLDAV